MRRSSCFQKLYYVIGTFRGVVLVLFELEHTCLSYNHLVLFAKLHFVAYQVVRILLIELYVFCLSSSCNLFIELYLL